MSLTIGANVDLQLWLSNAYLLTLHPFAELQIPILAGHEQPFVETWETPAIHSQYLVVCLCGTIPSDAGKGWVKGFLEVTAIE